MFFLSQRYRNVRRFDRPLFPRIIITNVAIVEVYATLLASVCVWKFHFRIERNCNLLSRSYSSARSRVSLFATRAEKRKRGGISECGFENGSHNEDKGTRKQKKKVEAE